MPNTVEQKQIQQHPNLRRPNEDLMPIYPSYKKYQHDYETFVSGAKTSDLKWLHDTRNRAATRFQELRFPTATRGNERWKYTSVAPIARTIFNYNPSNDADGVFIGNLNHNVPQDNDWTKLVFIDGHYRQDFSHIHETNITAVNLSSSLNDAEDRILKTHLARYADFEGDGFTALNTAFLTDGAFVHVPDHMESARPIHLVFLATDSSSPTVSYPRVFIKTGRNSKLTVIESYISLTNNPSFTNAVVEISAGESSEIDHYRLLVESSEAFHIGTTRVNLNRESSFSSTSLSRGAKLARNDLNVVLDAPGSVCTIRGLYMTSDSQHIDNHIDIDHATPHTSSDQYFKGVLTDQSRAVFSGRVLMRKNAQKSIASQKDLNLMLSDKARVNTKPSMEIYADDVQASHGATAGAVAEDALLYMHSRGIDEHTATSLLINGFASEIIDGIRPPNLRGFVGKMFSDIGNNKNASARLQNVKQTIPAEE